MKEDNKTKEKQVGILEKILCEVLYGTVKFACIITHPIGLIIMILACFTLNEINVELSGWVLIINIIICIIALRE